MPRPLALLVLLSSFAMGATRCPAADRVVFLRTGLTETNLYIANADGTAERAFTAKKFLVIVLRPPRNRAVAKVLSSITTTLSYCVRAKSLIQLCFRDQYRISSETPCGITRPQTLLPPRLSA